MRPILAPILISILAASACRREEFSAGPSEEHRPLETAFWIWNRSKPLTAAEIARLKAANVKRLYWLIGEIEIRDGRVIPKNQWPLPPATPDLDIVPVVRLEPTISHPAQIDPAALTTWLRKAGVTDAIQFDYDCPTPLLSDYARFLQDFRDTFGPVNLSTTALGDWCSSDQWPAVESAVDAVYPMLYDVLPEREYETPRPGHARPLVDADYLMELVRHWDAATSIPWRAGLPNITRLSIFREGRPKGHIRSWSLAEISLNPALIFEGDNEPGVSLFKVTSATRIGGIALQTGDWLCLRHCDRGELRSVIKAIRSTSAQGIVWFQLPRPGLASSGWSLAEIAGQFEGTPQLNASLQGTRLILTNTGNGDLPPRFDNGHVLTLSWPRPILREFIPGGFIAHEFLRDHQSVPAVAATTLRLRFPGLPAGESVASGLILFRQDENPLAINYRINDNDWDRLPRGP